VSPQRLGRAELGGDPYDERAQEENRGNYGGPAFDNHGVRQKTNRPTNEAVGAIQVICGVGKRGGRVVGARK